MYARSNDSSGYFIRSNTGDPAAGTAPGAPEGSQGAQAPGGSSDALFGMLGSGFQAIGALTQGIVGLRSQKEQSKLSQQQAADQYKQTMAQIQLMREQTAMTLAQSRLQPQSSGGGNTALIVVGSLFGLAALGGIGFIVYKKMKK